MEVVFSKHFKKQFVKLTPKAQKQFDIRFELWLIDPADPILRVHKLKGKFNRYYSFNINADLRAIYEVVDGYIYIYQMIGTHSQLYG